MERRIAAIRRENLKNEYQQEYLILHSEIDRVLPDFSKIEFIEKGEAERNESYKQLIPYIILQNRDGAVGLYQRRGTEKRLHGLWSAGFGGHIEDFEFSEGQDVGELVLGSAQRELKEEFSAKSDYPFSFRGIMNEERTKVGRTHIAWVFSAEVEPELFESSDEIGEIRWVSPSELYRYRMELWSEMAIELINVKQ